MAPCEASSHASIVLSFLVSIVSSQFRARMIRRPVASPSGGPSGADRGAARRAWRPKPPLPALPRLDRHRGPGREPMAQDILGRRGRSPAVREVLAIRSPDRFSDNTVKGCLGLSAKWRRIRTFGRQIMSLMLYPTELSVSWVWESNPASGAKSGALHELHPQVPTLRNGTVHSAAKPPARAETKAPTVVLASVFVTGSAPIDPATGCRKRHCRGGFAASSGSCISATPA